jgi:Flp pilus assembly pilin Flp
MNIRIRTGRSQSGQSLVEYGGVLAFVATLAGMLFLTGMGSLVPSISTSFTSVCNAMGGGDLATGNSTGENHSSPGSHE